MKRKPTKRQRPGRKPKKSAADVVADMARSGLVEDQIAQRLGVHKNVLRARHIDSIKTGKAAAAASEAEIAALTPSQYHFLRAVESSFTDSWIDGFGRNLLFRGVDGKGAKDINDAYAAWNGRFNVTGLSTKFDPLKAARYAEIVKQNQI